MHIMVHTCEGHTLCVGTSLHIQGPTGATGAGQALALGMSALLYVPAFASLCKRQPPIIQGNYYYTGELSNQLIFLIQGSGSP
jgi:hypothetical protein